MPLKLLILFLFTSIPIYFAKHPLEHVENVFHGLSNNGLIAKICPKCIETFRKGIIPNLQKARGYKKHLLSNPEIVGSIDFIKEESITRSELPLPVLIDEIAPKIDFKIKEIETIIESQPQVIQINSKITDNLEIPNKIIKRDYNFSQFYVDSATFGPLLILFYIILGIMLYPREKSTSQIIDEPENLIIVERDTTLVAGVEINDDSQEYHDTLNKLITEKYLSHINNTVTETNHDVNDFGADLTKIHYGNDFASSKSLNNLISFDTNNFQKYPKQERIEQPIIEFEPMFQSEYYESETIPISEFFIPTSESITTSESILMEPIKKETLPIEKVNMTIENEVSEVPIVTENIEDVIIGTEEPINNTTTEQNYDYFWKDVLEFGEEETRNYYGAQYSPPIGAICPQLLQSQLSDPNINTEANEDVLNVINQGMYVNLSFVHMFLIK